MDADWSSELFPHLQTSTFRTVNATLQDRWTLRRLIPIQFLIQFYSSIASVSDGGRRYLYLFGLYTVRALRHRARAHPDPNLYILREKKETVKIPGRRPCLGGHLFLQEADRRRQDELAEPATGESRRPAGHRCRNRLMTATWQRCKGKL